MKQALLNLIDEYGIDYYEKAVYEMIEEGRRFAINKIKAVLFPGTYRTVNFYDILNAEQPLRFQKDYYIHEPLEMTVTKSGELTLDYDGLSSPGYHSNNSSLSAPQDYISISFSRRCSMTACSTPVSSRD